MWRQLLIPLALALSLSLSLSLVQAELLPDTSVALEAGLPVRPLGPAQCEGRRLYVLDFGPQFHRDLLYGEQEHGVAGRGTGINAGFGAEKRSSERGREPTHMLRGVTSTAGDYHDYSDVAGPNGTVPDTERWPHLSNTWFDTWANALDVVVHSRMPHYSCIVTNPEEADLVFVAYYGSLDISRHIGKNTLQRGRLGRELALLLSQQPRFQRHQGRDHFVVLGRPYWDYIANLADPYNPWGTDFLAIPAMKGVKVVTIEGSRWQPITLGAPYTTSFHPPGSGELQAWRSFVESHERPHLFAFGGALRRGAKAASIVRAGILRERVFWQCAQSEQCRLLDCENPPRACEKDWRVFTQLYLSSRFCIHPPGDSCTRRAVLDGMLAGCIPVVLDRCTAEEQYEWLLGSANNFSVYLQGETLRGPPETDLPQGEGEGVMLPHGEVMLEQVLSAIPESRVRDMRKMILDVIPHITFGGKSNEDGSISPPDFPDAFDHLVYHLSKTLKESIAQQ